MDLDLPAAWGAPEIDPALVAGSFLVAVVVGLTGMGGGALMTPMMLLFFDVPPLAGGLSS